MIKIQEKTNTFKEKFNKYVEKQKKNIFLLSSKIQQANTIGIYSLQVFIILEFFQLYYYVIHPNTKYLWDFKAFKLAQDIAKYSQIDYFIKDYKSGAALFYFYFAIFLIFGSFGLMIYSIIENNKKEFGIKQTNNQGNINITYTILEWYFMLLDTILQIPFVSALSIQFFCFRDSCLSENFYSVINLIIAIVAILILCLQITFNLIFNYDLNPFSNYVYSGIGQQQKLLKVLNKIILPIYLVLDKEYKTQSYFMLIHLILMLILLASRLRNIFEVYDTIILKTQIFMEIGITWVNVSALIKKQLSRNSNTQMDLIYILIGYGIFVFLGNLYLQQQRNKYLFIDIQPNIKIDDFKAYIIQMIIYIKSRQGTNQYVELMGSLYYHQTNCKDLNCVCLNLNFRKQSPEFLQQTVSAWYHFVQVKANEFLEKYPKQRVIALIICFINDEQLQNHFKNIRNLERISYLDPSIQEEFNAYILQRKIEQKLQFQDQLNAKQNQAYSTNVALYQQQLNKVYQSLEYSVNQFQQFWTELKENRPDIYLLQKLGKKAQQSKQDAKIQIQKLFSISDQNLHILLVYQDYLTNIIQDVEESYKINYNISCLKNDRTNDSSQNQRRMLEQSGILIIVGNHHNFGEILHINSEITKKFGYLKKQLIGQHFDIFVPKSIQQRHTENLIQYINQNQQLNIQPLISTVMDDFGYGVLSEIQNQILPSISQGIKIISIIKELQPYYCYPYNYHEQSQKAQKTQNQKDYIYHFISYDQNDMQIIACSQSCYEFFGIHKDLINQNTTNALQFQIDLICPEIIKEGTIDKLKECPEGVEFTLDTTSIGLQFLQQNQDTYSNLKKDSESVLPMGSEMDSKQKKQNIDQISQNSISKQNSEQKSLLQQQIDKENQKYKTTKIIVQLVQIDKFKNVTIQFYDKYQPILSNSEQNFVQTNGQDQKMQGQTENKTVKASQNNEISVFDQTINDKENEIFNDLIEQNKEVLPQKNFKNKQSKSYISQKKAQNIKKQYKRSIESRQTNGQNKQINNISSISSAEEDLKLHNIRKIKKIQKELNNLKPSLLIIMLFFLSTLVFITYITVYTILYTEKIDQLVHYNESTYQIGVLHSRLQTLPQGIILSMRLHNEADGLTEDEGASDIDDFEYDKQFLQQISREFEDIQFEVMEELNHIDREHVKFNLKYDSVELEFFDENKQSYKDEYLQIDGMLLLTPAFTSISKSEFIEMDHRKYDYYNEPLKSFYFLMESGCQILREKATEACDQILENYIKFLDNNYVKNFILRIFILIITITFSLSFNLIWRLDKQNQQMIVIFSHIKNQDLRRFITQCLIFQNKYLIEIKPQYYQQEQKKLEQLIYSIEKQKKIKENKQSVFEKQDAQNKKLSQKQTSQQNEIVNQSGLDISNIELIQKDNFYCIEQQQPQIVVEDVNNQQYEQIQKKNSNSNSINQVQFQQTNTQKDNIQVNDKNLSNININDESAEEDQQETKQDKLLSQIKLNKFSLFWKILLLNIVLLGDLIYDNFRNVQMNKEFQSIFEHLNNIEKRSSSMLFMMLFLQKEIADGTQQYDSQGNELIQYYSNQIYKVEQYINEEINIQENFPSQFNNYISLFTEYQTTEICNLDYNINQFTMGQFTDKIAGMNFKEACQWIQNGSLDSGLQIAIVEVVETVRSYAASLRKEIEDLAITYKDNQADYEYYKFRTQIKYNEKDAFDHFQMLMYMIIPLNDDLIIQFQKCFFKYTESIKSGYIINYAIMISLSTLGFLFLWIPYAISMQRKLKFSQQMVSIIPVEIILDENSTDLKNAIVKAKIIQETRL